MKRLTATLALASSLAGAQPAPIALEHARELDLDGLRGLGPATTRRMLQEREHAPFRDWTDLMQRVPGIGPRKAQDLSEQGLRVQGQPYPSTPPRKAPNTPNARAAETGHTEPGRSSPGRSEPGH